MNLYQLIITGLLIAVSSAHLISPDELDQLELEGQQLVKFKIEEFKTQAAKKESLIEFYQHLLDYVEKLNKTFELLATQMNKHMEDRGSFIEGNYAEQYLEISQKLAHCYDNVDKWVDDRIHSFKRSSRKHSKMHQLHHDLDVVSRNLKTGAQYVVQETEEMRKMIKQDSAQNKNDSNNKTSSKKNKKKPVEDQTLEEKIDKRMNWIKEMIDNFSIRRFSSKAVKALQKMSTPERSIMSYILPVKKEKMAKIKRTDVEIIE